MMFSLVFPHFQLGKLAKKRSYDWKTHGPKSIILDTQFFRAGITCHFSTKWNCEIQSLKLCNLHFKRKEKDTKCCKGLRNDSWDARQSNQKQRDRYSGRDLVLHFLLEGRFLIAKWSSVLLWPYWSCKQFRHCSRMHIYICQFRYWIFDCYILLFDDFKHRKGITKIVQTVSCIFLVRVGNCVKQMLAVSNGSK